MSISTTSCYESPYIYEPEKIDWRNNLIQIDWVFGYFIIGAFTGLIVSLFFLGTIKQDVGSLARLAVISAFTGFIGPVLWKKQEETITMLIDNRIRDVFGSVEENEN